MVLRNTTRFAAAFALPLLVLLIFPLSAFASEGGGALYKLAITAKVTNWNASSCYDIVFVAQGTAYVSDNNISKATASVLKVKGKQARPIGQGLFRGPQNCKSFDFSQEGPTGNMVFSPKQEGNGQWHEGGGLELWAGDGNSTVRVFSLPSGKLLKTIQIGTPADKRADELDYIQSTNQVVFANPDAKPFPFLTYIDATTFKVVTTQVWDGTNGLPKAQALEQPRFYNGFQYQAVPGTVNPDGTLDNNGEIDKLDPRTHALLRAYKTPNCGPSGLTMIGDFAATGCANGPSEIVNLESGQVTGVHAANVPVGKGSDMVAGDVELGRFFFADYASSSLIITDVHGNVLTQPIATDGLAHSVAVDQDSHRVYVPEGSLGGVAQYIPV